MRVTRSRSCTSLSGLWASTTCPALAYVPSIAHRQEARALRTMSPAGVKIGPRSSHNRTQRKNSASAARQAQSTEEIAGSREKITSQGLSTAKVSPSRDDSVVCGNSHYCNSLLTISLSERYSVLRREGHHSDFKIFKDYASTAEEGQF